VKFYLKVEAKKMNNTNNNGKKKEFFPKEKFLEAKLITNEDLGEITCCL
jgi:hypothetical protein